MLLSRSKELRRREKERTIIFLIIVVGYADAHASDAIGGSPTAMGTEDLLGLASCTAIPCSI
jgi:hypothetical protein